MTSTLEDSLDDFLRNECFLEGDSLATTKTFLKKMGFKTRVQLLDFLPKLTLNDLIKLGLPEMQASAIMRHSNQPLAIVRKKRTSMIFSRLSSKYLNLEIIGYAYVQQEAIDLCQLCLTSKLFFINNFSLFNTIVKHAEKIIIKTVFDLLDERLHSRRYRLCYEPECDDGYDLQECAKLLEGKFQFYSITASSFQCTYLGKSRTTKLKIDKCRSIYDDTIPPSVTCLTIVGFIDPIKGDSSPRKFRKLSLLDCYHHLDILKKLATTTESLTISDSTLNLRGFLQNLAQVDCKQIIARTDQFQNQMLDKFLKQEMKAKKYIKNVGTIYLSNIPQHDWKIKHFTKKSLERMTTISLSKEYRNAATVIYTLFKGSLSLLKNKNIISFYDFYDFPFDVNVCFPNPDTKTNYIITDREAFAVIVLNNCAGLTQFKVDLKNTNESKYKSLAVEKLFLQELTISNSNDSFIPLITNILNKCKSTLRSLKCEDNTDLNPLRNSKSLNHLELKRCINDTNLEVLESFQYLIDLATLDERIVNLYKQSQNLKTFRFMELLDESVIKVLPSSVTTVYLQDRISFNDSIVGFLKQNLSIKEVKGGLAKDTGLQYTHEAAYLIDMFKHIKFNFLPTKGCFSFSQSYTYLHPEHKQVSIPAEKPDHIIYELLFQRLDNKSILFTPYFKAINDKEVPDYLVNSPPKMLDQMANFNEFNRCIENLLKSKLFPKHFDKVFNYQLVQSVDDEYLRIIVSTYDEVFQLGGNINQAITIIKGMTQREKQQIKRQSYFDHCKQNWETPLTTEDFNQPERQSLW
ncbi:hypothetical protein FGO68_gene13980 [Halteria grandinella]|uniref:Uncharacterized protein n=1 Tax=Halteria grandinella TaxID=5974 RepID=A0A8J8NWG5_HALGN|nr:hypothetical protein FGO68_gene13980 [Halteria grandinella]